MGGVMHHAHAGLRVRPLAWFAAAVMLAALLAPATAAMAADPPVIATGVVSGPGSPSRIEGATVSAFWYDQDFGEWLWSGEDVTDAEGRYAIPDALGYGERDYTFVVRAYGYVTQWRVEYWNGVDPLALDFGLVTAKPLATGKVYAGVGAPLVVEGAAIRASWQDPVSEEWYAAGEALTNGEGPTHSTTSINSVRGPTGSSSKRKDSRHRITRSTGVARPPSRATTGWSGCRISSGARSEAVVICCPARGSKRGGR
jgi:hypothetical protein